MSHLRKVLNAFASLLSYPDQHTAQSAELLYVVLQDDLTDAARELSRFGDFLEQHELWEIEEVFTRTFDVNPSCALEVGWHLFGEEYARGMFLVRMREELRKYNLPESAELPDHLAHVLAIVGAMPDHEAMSFIRACVRPAVAKMNEALSKTDTPYRHVVSCLLEVIQRRFGVAEPNTDHDVLNKRSPQVDLLHAFPVADVGCGGQCGQPSAEPDVVMLQSVFPTGQRDPESLSENRS